MTNEVNQPKPILSLPISVTIVNGGIVCDPNSLLVESAHTQIVWVLGTAGYHFPDQNAVVFKAPGEAFPYPASTLQRQLVTILDVCPKHATYSYTITVIDEATGLPISLDPEVQNGPPSCGDESTYRD